MSSSDQKNKQRNREIAKNEGERQTVGDHPRQHGRSGLRDHRRIVSGIVWAWVAIASTTATSNQPAGFPGQATAPDARNSRIAASS